MSGIVAAVVLVRHEVGGIRVECGLGGAELDEILRREQETLVEQVPKNPPLPPVKALDDAFLEILRRTGALRE